MNTIHPHDGPIFPELQGMEITYAKDQQKDGYVPLRTITDHTTVISRWTPTEAQRLDIAMGKQDIFLELKTFGGPLQPIRLTVGMTLDQAKKILHLTSADEET